jgi:hypothetical protein
MHTKFLSENLKGRDHAEDVGIDGRIMLDECGKVWIGFIWLRIGTNGRLL